MARGGQRWDGDETYGRVQGEWPYRDRAIARDGRVGDVRLSDPRDRAAAEAFLRSAWTVTAVIPDRIPTEGPDAYRRAIRHVFGDHVRHRPNRALPHHLEQDQRGITQRYRAMGGFQALPTAARFCRLFDAIRALFPPQSRRNQCLSLHERRCFYPDRLAQLMRRRAAA
jgi:putative transposase